MAWPKAGALLHSLVNSHGLIGGNRWVGGSFVFQHVCSGPFGAGVAGLKEVHGYNCSSGDVLIGLERPCCVVDYSKQRVRAGCLVVEPEALNKIGQMAGSHVPLEGFSNHQICAVLVCGADAALYNDGV